MRSTKAGTGITARTNVSYNPSDPGELALLQPALDGILAFMDRLDAIEAEARGVLRRAGLADQAPYRRDGHEPDSDVGYAARALTSIRFLRALIARGDAENASSFAFDLGGMLQEATVKWRHEAAAIEGANLRDARDKSNRQRRFDWSPWLSLRDDLRARHPDWSDSRIIAALRADGLDKTERHIRRVLFPKK